VSSTAWLASGTWPKRVGNQIVTVGCELAGGANSPRRDHHETSTFGPPLDNMRQCLLSGGIGTSLAADL